MKRLLTLVFAASCAAMLAGDAAGQLFRDEMVDPNGWGKNESSSDNTVTFGYDYSADGIPEAPHSQGGDVGTSGVKLEANNTDFVSGAVDYTLYPLGQSFSGKYQLRFDAWQNYNTFDLEQSGGAGTTEFLGGGIGYDPNGGILGVGHQIITTNDGDSGSDYRAFKGGYFVAHAEMVNGSRNATCCGPTGGYETLFPDDSGTPPAVQGQTGTPNNNRPGTSAFQWFTHTISVDGDIIRHQMTNDSGLTRNIVVYDNTLLDPNGPAVGTDGNISIYYGDLFSSVSPHPAHTFGIVDNVVVSVPEPATLAMFGIGGIGYAMLRRKRS